MQEQFKTILVIQKGKKKPLVILPPFIEENYCNTLVVLSIPVPSRKELPYSKLLQFNIDIFLGGLNI